MPNDGVYFDSISPEGVVYQQTLLDSEECVRLKSFIQAKKVSENIAVVVGLGFVGSAMIAALLAAKSANGERIYRVIGIDINDELNFWKIGQVSSGRSAVTCNDQAIDTSYSKGYKDGVLIASWLPEVYKHADVVIIDVNLDIKKETLGNSYDYDFTYEPLRKVLEPIAQRVEPDALIILETTVPPGTTEKYVRPLFEECFFKRGINNSQINLIHSFERVMPGKNYLKSITNYYRVYSGISEKCNLLAEKFFSSFINVDEYPLTRLSSPTASETTKLLENSYRATNIAFVKEWSDFAEIAGIDLFECLEAIRKRESHRNIMNPGFGVGGYCLTKDALLADWASENLYTSNRRLTVSLDAVQINDLMPDRTFELMEKYGYQLDNKEVGLFGVSYLEGIADTRCSPSKRFVDLCHSKSIEVHCHDPIVKKWPESKLRVYQSIEQMSVSINVIVFAVRHSHYLGIDPIMLLDHFVELKLIIDANNIVSEETRKIFQEAGKHVVGVGKGHWSMQ